MGKYNVGIKLKSGLGYSTEVEALTETQAKIKAVARANENGFTSGEDWLHADFLFVTTK